MQNFADQCLDMARAMLAHNLDSINADGTIAPVPGEAPRSDESGHAALALGEFFRATTETDFEGNDLVDLAARCITAQAFAEEEAENGLGYAALGLLSFGPAKERNSVWERLLDPTREQLDRRLLHRSDYEDHFQSFNVAKAVTRYSMGLSKKDETGRLIDRYVERCEKRSSAGYFDDCSGPGNGVAGVFDIYGPMSLVFIRQALQLHGNIHLRDRKLPSLRTIANKYLKLLPDLVRADGLGWAYGRGVGAYGQMHCISIILQSLRDGWIGEDKRQAYLDLLRRLFQFFFMSYLDQEAGFLVIRDSERNTMVQHTTRMANFDGVRYLCQWSRLARSIGGDMTAQAAPVRNAGRWVIFDKTAKKEQGLFIYQHPESGLHVHIPLVGANKRGTADSLAFPHFPGIFDWPADGYLPILVPELTFGDKVITPSFYGRRCVTGLGLRQSFYFRYEQPELITKDEEIVPGLGSAKVAWTFSGQKITSEFTFSVKNPVTCDSMRYVLAIGGPHSEKHVPMTFMLGPNGLGCTVEKDDFHASWQDTEVVTNEPEHRTYWGNLHYLQTLVRDHPLNMRPGMQYKLVISFEPDIALLDS